MPDPSRSWVDNILASGQAGMSWLENLFRPPQAAPARAPVTGHDSGVGWRQPTTPQLPMIHRGNTGLADSASAQQALGSAHPLASLAASLGLSLADAEGFFMGDWGMGGGGKDNSLGWAQLSEQGRQFDASQSWAREMAAIQAQMEQQALAQRRREMAGQLGQGIGQTQSQIWAQGLPHALPTRTNYAPGTQPGGSLSRMHQMAGMQYVPQHIEPHPGPTKDELEHWIDSAMGRWG